MLLPYWPRKGKSSCIEQQHSKIMNLAMNSILPMKQFSFYRRSLAEESLQCSNVVTHNIINYLRLCSTWNRIDLTS